MSIRRHTLDEIRVLRDLVRDELAAEYIGRQKEFPPNLISGPLSIADVRRTINPAEVEQRLNTYIVAGVEAWEFNPPGFEAPGTAQVHKVLRSGGVTIDESTEIIRTAP
jgi:hypothetical protein